LRQGERCWREIPEDALFFFGSKRSWVFPSTDAEIAESKKQSSSYTSEVAAPMRALILEKEERNEVFWLKPPGFLYRGGLYEGDPNAFDKASVWLQSLTDPVTGEPYPPLKLDVQWWMTEFQASSAKYTGDARTICRNFRNGAHDYDPVQELLYQSCPTLEPVL